MVCNQILVNIVKPHQIGVTTPYEGQHSYVVQYTQFNGTMCQKLYKQLEVANVDAFQGHRKIYLLYHVLVLMNMGNGVFKRC